ncbi:uncharacterized protein PFL1_02850 [Pseudozyma flocculosa PF-1]|uniref:Uncharacterized protein n=2 Tax=Pseudozyma flocculosa TaxID=84751 RepID=A0A5C3F2G5_9BASI|nr:uncharacterized protein PFL1_02850 [Pseudozyma flocculosa PF-1]EPQ29631.1 hypothetical protein PFL1_02850 [Pseudozyma flocculosa PF-1]SPO38195.1 uncharacterized protein PSFLO_03672 [Pseudozyma flocculosa]
MSYAFHFPSPPLSSHTTSTGGITIRSHPRQDWWRTPPPTRVERAEGPFYCRRISATSPRWRFSAWITSDYTVQYDQAGVLLFAGRPAEQDAHWIKAGVEMEHGATFLACVTSAPWSDFSTSPSPSPSPITPTQAVFIQLTRNTTEIGDTIVIKYYLSPPAVADDEDRHRTDPSWLPDDKDLVQLREIPAFNVLPDGSRRQTDEWYVGVMTCGPKNDEGTQATFEALRFEEF